MPVTECVRRGAPTARARAHRGHAARRPRAPEFGDGELDLDAVLGALLATGYAASSRSSCPATPTPRTTVAARQIAALRASPERISTARPWKDPRRDRDPSAGRATTRIRQVLDATRRRSATRVAAEVAEDPSTRSRPSRRPAARPAAARSPGPTTSCRGRRTRGSPRADRGALPRAATRAEAELRELYRYGDAAERRGGPARPAGSTSATAASTSLLDALRTNDTRLIAAALGPYATEHLDDDAQSPGRPQVRVRRRARHAARRARARGADARAGAACSCELAAGASRRGPAGRRQYPPDVQDRRDRGLPRAVATAARPPNSTEQKELLMRIFDPHIHMTSRTTDDYEAMYASGVRALVEPAFWLGQPRTSRRLVHRLLRRAARLGALPRRAVRHRPPLHDRPQPQGGQRRPLRARCSTSCRATSPRTASSPSARSASTR